jgi:hypothetical protein
MKVSKKSFPYFGVQFGDHVFREDLEDGVPDEFNLKQFFVEVRDVSEKDLGTIVVKLFYDRYGRMFVKSLCAGTVLTTLHFLCNLRISPIS